jgi:hypothetical protein
VGDDEQRALDVFDVIHEMEDGRILSSRAQPTPWTAEREAAPTSTVREGG